MLRRATRVPRLLILCVASAAVASCSLFMLPRCPRPRGERWAEYRRASEPDPQLQRAGVGRLHLSVVLYERGRLDSTLSFGVYVLPLRGDTSLARRTIGDGWLAVDSLSPGLWQLQPYRIFAAEQRPFIVEARAGFADSVRVATRYTKVVYVACRARRAT